MGYTHRWRMPNEISASVFQKITSDMHKMIPRLERLGIVFAGPDGEGSVIINNDIIAFNGATKCGHFKTEPSLTIPWPTENAKGIIVGTKAEKPADTWAFGHLLSSRRCNGDCSYEAFIISRKSERQKWEQSKDRVSNFCKTAFRPYDFAVQVALIIAYHHLISAGGMQASSDGPDQWKDAISICEHYLGYGKDFTLDNAV